jgi:hypothetical protein
MSEDKLAKLNSVDHASFCVAKTYAAELGDDVMTCLVFTTEMRTLQGTYPLLMQRIEGHAAPLPVALMGLEKNENLFLDASDSGWTTETIPLMMQKGPFYIAKEQDSTGATRNVIALDERHPKLSLGTGERLFSDAGGYSDYLERIIALLENIEASQPHTLEFAATLDALDLITPLDFKCTLKDGSMHTLTGFYGIDEDCLQQLPETTLNSLHQKGFLLPLFMMLASQSQVSRLLAFKNGKL